MKSWFSKNWSFGLTALAILAGYFSTPFRLKFVYWLYILGRQYYYSFILFAWLMLIGALVIWMIGKLIKRPVKLRIAAIIIMLLSNILVTIISPIDFFLRMEDFSGHLLSFRSGFQVYHLTISAPDSMPEFYSLYRCDDGLGIFCRPIADIRALVCKGSYSKSDHQYMSTCEGTSMQADLKSGMIDVLENGKIVYFYDPY